MLEHDIMVPKQPTSLESANGKPIVSFDDEDDSDINSYDNAKLKQKLRIAAENCQLLAQKLCGNDLSPAGKVRMSTSLDRYCSLDGDCCQEQKLKMKAIVAENIRLRQVLKDVTEINKRWQKYNSQQQDHVQRLQATIEVLQTGHDLASRPCLQIEHVPFRQEEDRTKMSLMEHTQTLNSLRKSYEKAVQENCRLEKLVEELRLALVVKDQANDLKEKPLEYSKDCELHLAREQAELHMVQARVHKEDWEVEKAEKEDAKRKLARAEVDIKELSSKCLVFESQLQRIHEATLGTPDGCFTPKVDPWEKVKRPSSDLSFLDCNSHQGQMEGFQFEPQVRVLSRGPAKRSPEGPLSPVTPDYDVKLDLTANPLCEVRTPVSPSSFPQRTRPTSSHLPLKKALSRQASSLDDSSKDVVTCSKCGRQFSTSEHLCFLDHFEECQKTKRTNGLFN